MSHNPAKASALDFKDSSPPRDLVIAMWFLIYLQKTYIALTI